MFRKVEQIKPLENYELIAKFQSGEEKKYDMKPLLEKQSVFVDLRLIKGLFDCVKVDTGGYGISWNDEIDLSANELWNNGMEI
ncbi:MAG: DUF2442 domain-containing protein [Oscillospiraceae bacterium]|nr:DUF2442 domain-containing protein [Oscillospiraceae bacterium]